MKKVVGFIFIPLLLILLMTLLYFAFGRDFVTQIIYKNNPKYSPKACEEDGGRWMEIRPPAGFHEYCYYAPADEGKKCYQNSECTKDCVSTNEVDVDGYFIGKCGEYSIFNCIPTIPNKTKNRKQLQGGSCV